MVKKEKEFSSKHFSLKSKLIKRLENVSIRHKIKQSKILEVILDKELSRLEKLEPVI